MPWKRAKALPPPDNTLFEQPFRIAREAGCPVVVENVRGAEKWVGKAKWHYGSYYLWGDLPALMPKTRVIKQPGRNFHVYALTNGAVSSPSFHGADHETRCLGLGVKTIGHVNKRDGYSHTRHLTNQRESDAVKQHGSGAEWFDIGIARHSSRCRSRKEASATIAMIPFDLARWIGEVYYPRIEACK